MEKLSNTYQTTKKSFVEYTQKLILWLRGRLPLPPNPSTIETMPRWKDRRDLLASRTPDSVKRSRLIMRLTKLAFLGVVLMFFAVLIGIPLLAYDLPSPDQVVRREGFSSKILDRNGKPLYDIFEDGRRIPVEFNQIPEDLRNATIAIEDKNFYTHGGFDVMGMLRGLSRQFTRGRAQRG
jgi:membrane peptidoglycan carboxypeptidase